MSLARQSLSLLSRDVFVYGSKILTSAVVARTLGPEVLGIWYILALIPSYGEAIGRLKVDAAAVYFLGRGRYGLGEVAFLLFVIALVSGGVLMGLGIWQVELIEGYFFPDTEVPHFIIYIVLSTIPLNFLAMNCGYLLLHLEDIPSYNWLVVLRSLLPSLLTIGLIFAMQWKLLALVLGSLVSLTIALVFGLYVTQRHERMVFRFNFRMAREMIGYGGYLYLELLLTHVYTYFASLVAVRYFSTAQMAFFRLGQESAQLLNKVPEALALVLYPRISKAADGTSEETGLSMQATRVLVLMLVPMGFLAALGVYPATRIVYGSEYLPMIVPFLIMLPGVLFLGCSTPIAQYFMGSGRARTVLKLAFVPLVCQIGLSFWLVPVYGMIGASLATSVTLMALAASRVLAFVVTNKVSISALLLPRRRDVEIVSGFIRQLFESAIRMIPGRTGSTSS